MLSSAWIFSSCSSDENRTMSKAAKAPLGAGNPQKANNELEDSIRASLTRDAQLRSAPISVSADVTRNQATLSGTVASESLRRKAVELAKSAQAGVIVLENLRVKGDEPGIAPP